MSNPTRPSDPGESAAESAPTDSAQVSGWRARLEVWLDQAWVRNTILTIIILNAVVLGMETSQTLMARIGPLLTMIDRICLSIFVVELALKMLSQGRRFVRRPWNLFDFIIIGIALLPTTGGLSVLRALRILRVLRVISFASSLRRVVQGFLSALPGMGSVFLLMGMIFYIGAVMATKLFGATHPEWFGTIGESAYTLFQVMTLESWSMGIVRPVMEAHPWAWAFFVPFIMVTTFAVVNLLVGLIVNSMQDAHAQEANAATDGYRSEVMDRLASIETELKALRKDRE